MFSLIWTLLLNFQIHGIGLFTSIMSLTLSIIACSNIYQCFSFIFPFAFSSSLLISCQLCLLAVTFIYLYINFSCSAISHFHLIFFFTIFISLLKSCHLKFYSSVICSIVGLYFFFIGVQLILILHWLNSRHWVWKIVVITWCFG